MGLQVAVVAVKGLSHRTKQLVSHPAAQPLLCPPSFSHLSRPQAIHPFVSPAQNAASQTQQAEMRHLQPSRPVPAVSQTSSAKGGRGCKSGLTLEKTFLLPQSCHEFYVKSYLCNHIFQYMVLAFSQNTETESTELFGFVL